MENLKINARNFICTIQACSEQQQKVFQEILEGLHSYIEEILISIHITVGETDSVDVQELLYHDFLELVRHLKREKDGGKGAQTHQQKGVEDTVQGVGHKVTAKPVEKMTGEKRKYHDKPPQAKKDDPTKNQEKDESEYFDQLKNMEEKQIRSLHKRVTVIVCSITQTRGISTSTRMITAEEIISMKMEAQERAYLTEFLSVATSILQDVFLVQPGDQMLERILKSIETHRTTFNYQNEVYEVDEITKRNLGKMVIRLVGHEGMETKPDLRRLLQACIDFVQKKPGGWWKNASITIYDEDDNMYKIASGAKKEQFICEMVNGEPIIRNKLESRVPKKPKVYNEQAPGQSGRQRDYCLLM